MEYPKIVTKEIPINQIHPDPKQPQGDLLRQMNNKKNRLLLSMKEFGLRSPLAVVKMDENNYRIIGDPRCYLCAQLLGWESMRCEVHPESNEGEIKRIRFDLQNYVHPWTALERSREFKEIKSSFKFKTNKELAEYLHFPEHLLVVSMSLQKRREEYQELMDKYELSENYQIEFVRLEPKIRVVKDFTREKIIQNIFDRVKHQVIRSSHDFWRLGYVFLKAHANEKELYKFLNDPDMRVSELVEKTKQDSYIRDLESVIKQTSTKISEGATFAPDVKKLLIQFKNLLTKGIE